jgi:pimeloyl-ACP methyl ester carboxylesterase
VPTPPAGSIRARAVSLRDLARSVCGPGDAIHLVGHSSGGLDARLLAAPGSTLDAADVADRVRTVITVSTPHHGTPLAGVFSTLQGRRLLRIFAVVTSMLLRRGTVPIALGLRLGEVLARVDALGETTVLDELYTQLLGELSEERRAQVAAFLDDLGGDQALLEQLRPEAMDLFAASVADRPGVRYGCLTTRSPAPGFVDAIKAATSPSGQAGLAWYAACWRLASRYEAKATPSEAQRRALVAGYGGLPEPADNDGMVPTLSQVHGEVLSAEEADHLDVIGHFDAPRATPPHVDWVRTGAGYTIERFEHAWTKVLDVVLEG